MFIYLFIFQNLTSKDQKYEFNQASDENKSKWNSSSSLTGPFNWTCPNKSIDLLTEGCPILPL